MECGSLLWTIRLLPDEADQSEQKPFIVWNRHFHDSLYPYVTCEQLCYREVNKLFKKSFLDFRARPSSNEHGSSGFNSTSRVNGYVDIEAARPIQSPSIGLVFYRNRFPSATLHSNIMKIWDNLKNFSQKGILLEYSKLFNQEYFKQIKENLTFYSLHFVSFPIIPFKRKNYFCSLSHWMLPNKWSARKKGSG